MLSKVFSEIRALQSLREDELFVYAKEHQVEIDGRGASIKNVVHTEGGLAPKADVIREILLRFDAKQA